ncbi:MAG: hypothetical protein AB7V61_03275, partial [Methylocystis sp.]
MASLKTIPGNCADFAASAGLFSNHLEKALRASLSNTSPFDVTASRATASFYGRSAGEILERIRKTASKRMDDASRLKR